MEVVGRMRKATGAEVDGALEGESFRAAKKVDVAEGARVRCETGVVFADVRRAGVGGKG